MHIKYLFHILYEYPDPESMAHFSVRMNESSFGFLLLPFTCYNCCVYYGNSIFIMKKKEN